jgi:hypothetical protein
MAQGGQDALEAKLPALAMKNPFNAALLGRLPALGLPDAWLVSGCLFQTVWNLQDGHAPTRGIRDYDIFYFDPDLSWEAEDRWIKRAAAAFADLPVEIEVKNQARVHLWYEQKFALSGYPRLRRAAEGIDYFLAPCCMVGLRRTQGEFEVYAPAGLGDLSAKIVRPNRRWLDLARRERYYEKAARWQPLWPSMTVIPWPEESAISAPAPRSR